MTPIKKILIIRLSSFGDIIQSLAVPAAIKENSPKAEIHWVTKSNFAELLTPHPLIKKIWSYEKSTGLIGWIKLINLLKKERFTHIYDAHSNSRSHILSILFFISCFTPPFNYPFKYLKRPKNRIKRFLLFSFQKNFLPKPFKGQKSFLAPLKKWGCSNKINSTPQFYIPKSINEKIKQSFSHIKLPIIAIAPSAAWKMKRWPLEHWKKLVLLENLNQFHFIILGGPDDRFCQDIQNLLPKRSTNLAGKLSLIESCAAIDNSKLIISADTGLLHVADLLGKNNIALIGPTAFGYPSHPNSTVLETNLTCRPCSKDGRGKCRQEIYQKCLVDITPEQVANKITSKVTEQLNKMMPHR